MQRFRILLVLCVANSFAPTPAMAQDNPCLRRSVPLSFVVPPGTTAPQITVADLRGKIAGKPVQLLSLAADDRPHRIVIILDGSGSMRAVWEGEIGIAAALAAIRAPKLEFALLFFGSSNSKTIDFSKGQTAVQAWLNLVQSDLQTSRTLAYGPSAIYDWTLTGLDLIHSPTSADALFLLSDGDDNSSDHKWKDVTTRFESAGVRLFFVGLSEDDPVARYGEKYSKSTWVALARSSGGDAVRVRLPRSSRKRAADQPTNESLNWYYTEAVANLRLELELPELLKAPKSWELKLVGLNREPWKGMRLVYPPHLAPCPNGQPLRP